jgi:hypothetical protein
MASINDLLTDTGEIDPIKVAEVATLRAAREFGSPNFPPTYLRNATQLVVDRARALRTNWRQHHGLPDDSPVSAWTSLAPDTNE